MSIEEEWWSGGSDVFLGEERGWDVLEKVFSGCDVLVGFEGCIGVFSGVTSDLNSKLFFCDVYCYCCSYYFILFRKKGY